MNSRVHQNHFARKRFGQNFLHDGNVIENIVAAIHPQKNEALVEIGPGLAALTLPIARLVDHLTVIEIDRDLAQRLASHTELAKKLTVIQKDAMNLNFNALAETLKQPIRVFGNLPYNISTPLMFHLFNAVGNIKDMHFMLQKEVVNRLTATHNTKSYGKLTVMTQYYCQIISILDVPPTAFTPSPKVNSAVVRLTPYQNSPYYVKDINLLNQVTSHAFNQRRKTIRNSLSAVINAEQLISLGLDPILRAENLSIHDYCQITNYLTDSI